MDGKKIREWSRTMWVTCSAPAMFLFVLILLQPGSGYIGKSETPAMVPTLVMFFAFGLSCVLFWANFRYRKARPSSGSLEAQPAFEGGRG